jgi:capsular polysaccharide biosynthesis protein
MLSQDEDSPQVLISERIDQQQLEILKEFYSADRLRMITRQQIFLVETLRLFVHETNRQQVISGNLSGREMINPDLMKELSKLAGNLNETTDYRYEKIFIARPPTSLRKLTNYSHIAQYLLGLGFTVIQPENLSLSERINIFRSAKIAIAESGAGTVNFYFCTPSTKIIELRHPLMTNSREYEAIEATTGGRFQMIVGKKPGIWDSIRFGRDSFSVPINDLSKLLSSPLEEYHVEKKD